MYHQKTVSVVMPAYNEAKGITTVVKGFKKMPFVDEVVVANNNSKDDTAALAKKAGARVVTEMVPGYGSACQRALREAKGDLIILVESDDTFDPKDIEKFLAYADEFDLVMGTRTSKALIWSGSNMGIFLKYGNWFVGKVLEFLHNGPSLTDVGCTYRLIRKEALQKIQGKFTVKESHFLPEMTILALKKGLRVVEIPVNYKKRMGESKITGTTWKAFRLGIRMIGFIVAKKFSD